MKTKSCSYDAYLKSTRRVVILDLEKLKPILDIVVGYVPDTWCEIKISYFVEKQISRVLNEYREEPTDEWKHFNCGSFDVMDLFEDFVSREFLGNDRSWSSMSLIFSREGGMEIEYGFDEIDIINL